MTWQDDARDVPDGSLFVPIAQPQAMLIMQLMEPQAPDSFVSWGFFNNAFERKEYLEEYVAEFVFESQGAGSVGADKIGEAFMCGGA